jgi:hypothetical protein
MTPLDTTPAAAAVQETAHLRLGPSGRLTVACELSDLAHRLALSGIRQRHPEYTDEQAMAALVRLLYGKTR